MNEHQKLITLIVSCADSAFDGRFGHAIKNTARYDSRFGYAGISIPALHAMACVLKHSSDRSIPYSFRGGLTKRSAFSGIKDDSMLIVFPHSPQLDEDIDTLSYGLIRRTGVGLDEAVVQIDVVRMDSKIDELDARGVYGTLCGTMTQIAGYSMNFFKDMNTAFKTYSNEDDKNAASDTWEKRRIEYLERAVDAFLGSANESRLKEYLQFKAA